MPGKTILLATAGPGIADATGNSGVPPTAWAQPGQSRPTRLWMLRLTSSSLRSKVRFTAR